MLVGKRVLALIPARAGSKRLPRKNVRLLGGRPLFQWSVDAAHSSGLVDAVVVSTDDPQVERHAASLAVTVLRRPPKLSTDEATTASVILHTLKALPDYDLLVLLQPTSPLRSAADVDRALERLVHSGQDAVVSVRRPTDPVHLLRREVGGLLQPAIRLDSPDAGDSLYVLNGAIFAAWVPALLRVGGEFARLPSAPFLMGADESIDIDFAADLARAREVLHRRSKAPAADPRRPI